MRLTHHQRQERPAINIAINLYDLTGAPFDIIDAPGLVVNDRRDINHHSKLDLDDPANDDTILDVLRALRDRRTDLYDHVFGEPYDGSQQFGTNTIKVRLDFTASSRPPGDGER